ncbi:FtsW/RodA/SpoVE family cell cycle protein [Phormidium tenue]|uniref:Probable peptidoglycan glycosyltransferase FtsW n=1 Tax=Phormidium tenue NIES-30 TaxID=549789 RepID=A0A1U7JAY8_9CYAN|nr:FtsW/RodA/SpoVE family cell cycle protein [Phormidium tenue]MBD2230361.1 FtsW/RodA/SpoVE family cell cycle protein [Phormidium tenue FACHB-1052]OKH50839.1 cell division protein FtsW [Phormidium tenue NIES-30]
MNIARLVPWIDPTVSHWSAEARWLRWLTFVWLGSGLLVLFSASYAVSVAEHGYGLHYVMVQLLWVAIGLVIFNRIVHTSLDRLIQGSGIVLLVLVGLVSLTLVPSLGVTVNGATRWLPLGPFMIQPSELLKPCLVLQGARLFGRWPQLTWQTRLTWLGIFVAILGLILLQPNLSTAAICGLTLWLIALAAGLPYLYLLLTAGGGLLTATVSVSLKTYQRQRIVSFLDPWADAGDQGYQLVQSLLAVGSGGFWGQGFGLSQQKLYSLPIQYTDFIFSVFAEEFGFVGCLVLLTVLGVYASLALLVALRLKQPLHRLVAVGAMVLLVGQALLNMGVATGLLPTTGLPFPLLSYGGSSMMASLATAALLVRAAREINLDTPVPLRQRWSKASRQESLSL